MPDSRCAPTIITCRPVSEAGLPCNGIVAVAACLVKPQSGHRGAMRHRVEPTTAGKASLMLYRTAPGTGRGPAETGVSFRPRSGLARWLSQMESVAALYRMCLKIDVVACRGVGLWIPTPSIPQTYSTCIRSMRDAKAQHGGMASTAATSATDSASTDPTPYRHAGFVRVILL